MLYAETLGLIAGFFTTIAYAPQAIKAYKTKSTKDISILWLAIAGFGTTLWIFYGFLISSVPIILWNIGCDILIAVLITLKLNYH
jgi:MtN3 and saliva related transmembrane protein